jgi:AraC family ethanolamine operon transcriptional activator
MISVYAPGSEHHDATTDGCCEAVIVAPRSFRAFCEAQQCELPDSGSHVLESSTAAIEQLRRLLLRLSASPVHEHPAFSSAASQRAISEALSGALLEVLRCRKGDEGNAGRPRMPRAAILRQIVDVMEAGDGNAVRAGDLADAVGISQASLQRVFHEWYGVSPARYLTLKRFYSARRRLRQRQDSTVTAAATALGFWDLSRFSKTYFALFGELPSDTLRSASRPIACKLAR